MTTRPRLTAWFTKQPQKRGKAQKRFFELHYLPLSAEIRYFEEVMFDAETRTQMGKGEQKGSIPIYKDSLILFGGKDPELFVHNPTRTWKLTAEKIEEARAWGGLLRKVVSDAKAVDLGEKDPETRYEKLHEPTPQPS
eukprot:m.31806 g.31806  ORF g.31806 m.31806 type:complete len:138 (+) comp16523_c0_seq1:117-530(+)